VSVTFLQTDLSFGREYTAAVEAKQVAQQEAQRAQFVVEKAKQEKQGKIVQAEGEAEAATMISNSALITHTHIHTMPKLEHSIIPIDNKTS
jgi:regulator of protease activity HflC (stomatin/prohibitin superfamily)